MPSQKEKLNYRKAAMKYKILDYKLVEKWERINFEEGAGGLYIEGRGRTSAANGKKKGVLQSRIKSRGSPDC